MVDDSVNGLKKIILNLITVGGMVLECELALLDYMRERLMKLLRLLH